MAQDAFVKNAGDEEQVRKGGEKELTRRQQELADILWVLSDPRGRRFIWKLLGKCGVFRTSFTGNSQTFFNEGERSIGLFVTSEVTEARPEAYLEMMIESQNKDKK